jgi:hypothetical protein
MKKNT